MSTKPERFLTRKLLEKYLDNPYVSLHVFKEGDAELIFECQEEYDGPDFIGYMGGGNIKFRGVDRSCMNFVKKIVQESDTLNFGPNHRSYTFYTLRSGRYPSWMCDGRAVSFNDD